jgi:hypothetical protein
MRTVLVLLVLTLIFVLPAEAVVMTCVKESNEVMRIDYSAADETVLPIAFAINVALDNGATITRVYDYKVGDSNSADPGYGIFPYSMEVDVNGKVVDWGTPVLSGGPGASSVSLGMASRYNGSQNAPLVRDTLCRIGIDPHGAQTVNVAITRNTAAGGIVLENGTAAKFSTAGTSLGVRVTKCTVTAGSKPTSDSILASGYIDGAADGFLAPGSVVVTITSANMVNPCVQMFPIDGTTYKNGKFKSSRTVTPLKTSFTFDTKTSKFTFSAKNVSLKGLSCPLSIETAIGGYTGKSDVNETIVNGSKKPIPIKLMMGVKDSLRVDKTTVRRSTKPGGEQLTVKGGFAAQNVSTNMVIESFSATLGPQTFTIPANNFKANKSGFACSKIVLSDGSVAAANFNFTNCTFTLTIKNTKIAAGAGSAELRLKFALFNQFNTVNIP